MKANTAEQWWTQLDGKRTALMKRTERYAALTISKVCYPDGHTVESADESHDYQSMGAQATKHIVNKLMVAMFAPSRPFFRISPTAALSAELAATGMTETELEATLSDMERKATKRMDALGQRPKLYQLCRHLVVTGNVLMTMDKGHLRVQGMKYFCVKRNADQTVHTLVIREKLQFGELVPTVQEQLKGRYAEDTVVSLYKLIQQQTNKSFVMTQWVDEYKLADMDARWKDAESCPYKVLVWDLADESDYATGLVEEYVGDLEAASVLSEAIVTGAVVGTEFRWVVHPNGMTTIEDMRKSVNGDSIPGTVKDIGAVSPAVHEAVKIADAINTKYEQRIARGFLLNGMVTRDAERVTAEEIRLQTNELESAFGGTYSVLAPSVQRPLAKWMLDEADLSIKGTKLDVTIITGLDALSRTGDLDNLRNGISILAGMMNVPEQMLARMKWQELATFVGQGVGVDLTRFVMNDQEFGDAQNQARAAQAAQEANTAGGIAQAEAAAQPPQ